MGQTLQRSDQAGLAGVVAPVRTVTIAGLPAYTRTGNTLLANANGALPSQGGVSLSVGDRLLVLISQPHADNGVYVVGDLGSGSSKWQMTRSSDMSFSSQVQSGLVVPVGEGSDAGLLFYISTADPITLNTTALTFSAVLTSITSLFGGSQGDILYRDASGWTRLAAGAAGAKLMTNGAGANPSWVTPLAQVSSPGNPTGNATTTLKMQGLAVSFTPAATGRIVMFVSGELSNNTAGDGVQIETAYGTGSAPANGDAATGTAINNVRCQQVVAAAKTMPFCIVGYAALSSGTTYWFDLIIAAITGGTATLTNLKVVIFEN